MVKKKIIGLIFVLIFTLTINLAIGINSRILYNNITVPPNSIFIPKGIANKYNDYLLFGFDDYRIWEYKLDDKKIIEISGNLNNGIWKRLENQNIDIIEFFFKNGTDNHIPEELTENVYFCIYDYKNSVFSDLKSDMNIPGGHVILFAYDYYNNFYWCVSKSI